MKLTEKEIYNIIDDYKNGISPRELSNKYKRDYKTIISKLRSFGVYKNNSNRITEDDIKFLKRYYPIGDFESIFKRFPTFSKQRIISLCSKYKISADYYNNKKWTKQELEVVKNHYYNKSLEEIFNMLNQKHSLDAIQTKALKKFGYSKDRTWTNEEINTLKVYYPIETVDEVCCRLPKRTKQAIIKKANSLNIKNFTTLNTYWSEEDEKLLIDNWKNMTDDELSKLIGRSRRSVLQKRGVCGLTRINHFNKASYENIIKYIRGNIGCWKKDSMRNCNYKCILTGSKDFEIHHLYSLSSIFNEVIEENQIILKDNFSDYTKEELSFILSKFIEKQNQYPLGICIRTDIHNLFHKIYGKTVSPKMWDDFEKDYKKGKYVN